MSDEMKAELLDAAMRSVWLTTGALALSIVALVFSLTLAIRQHRRIEREDS